MNYLFFVLALLLESIILNLLKIPLFFQVIIYIITISPILAKKISSYLKEEELENNFPIFLRDLSHYLEIGQPLPIALRSLKQNDYGELLNWNLRKILTEMEFGETFIEAFERMARRIKSPKVKKTIYSIIEAEKMGGDIKGLLENLSRSLEELIEIKKERISKLKNFMLIYYGIFISLLISIALIIYFIRKFLQGLGAEDVVTSFKSVVLILLTLNAVFTGLVIGKISSGRVISGIIHSIVLLLLSAFVYSFFL